MPRALIGRSVSVGLFSFLLLSSSNHNQPQPTTTKPLSNLIAIKSHRYAKLQIESPLSALQVYDFNYLSIVLQAAVFTLLQLKVSVVRYNCLVSSSSPTTLATHVPLWVTIRLP